MTDGGNSMNNDGQTPPPPPMPPTPGVVPGSDAPRPAWYENAAIVILALFCCSPLGLVLVWINKTWTTKTKAIITAVIVGLAVVGTIIGAVSGGSSSDTSTSATTAATQSTDGSKTTTAPASTKTCKDTPNTESFDSKKQGLYPSRAGVTKTDHEAALGDCVRISGATTYVTAATVTTDSITNKQGIIVTVSETNRDKATKSYNALDWKIQTPQGTIENMTIIFGDNTKTLSAGELVTGGTIEGTVAFDYAGPGTYYVLYEPVLSMGSDIGVWGINVP